MKFHLFPYVIIVSLAGCAPLTSSQVSAVNGFALASQGFSAYPARILNELADIRMKRSVYFANSLDNPRFHKQELDSIYAFNKQDRLLTEKVDLTFKIIDKYAQSLVLLSSDKHSGDLKVQSLRFGTDLDSLTTLYNSKNFGLKLPTAIGSAVSQVVAFGGSQYLRRKQAKEIKKFVFRADQLIAAITGSLLEFLDSKNINTLVEIESRGISGNYLSFLRQSKTVSSAFNGKDTTVLASNTRSSINNDLEYLRLRESIDNVRDLKEETREATIGLRKAHAKLLESMQERRKLKTAISEIQEFVAGVTEIRETLSKIEKYKSAKDESND